MLNEDQAGAAERAVIAGKCMSRRGRRGDSAYKGVGPRFALTTLSPNGTLRVFLIFCRCLIEEVSFAMDSPLEGGGFELLVPRNGARVFPSIPRIAHRIGSCSASPEAFELA